MEALEKIANGPEPNDSEPIDLEVAHIEELPEIEYENDNSVTEPRIRGELSEDLDLNWEEQFSDDEDSGAL